MGRERWAETVVERLQRLSRSIVVTALRNNQAFDARSPRLYREVMRARRT